MQMAQMLDFKGACFFIEKLVCIFFVNANTSMGIFTSPRFSFSEVKPYKSPLAEVNVSLS